MKKTYAAPTVLTNGNVVRNTLGGPKPSSSEVPLKTFKQAAGSVGFYL